MIKYIEFPAVSPYGKHVHVIDGIHEGFLMKTAGMNYAPEIMDFVRTMKRTPGNIYVVVNALGTTESWGINTNGDAFPRNGLKHVSLRGDKNTPNDYGYKTFEYYGHLYKHHINKDPKRAYGRILYAHWNALMDRVELIVEIDAKHQDIIDDVENDDVYVSMGCRVRYDRCSICDNRRGKGQPVCKHVKKYLGQIIDEALAKQWSKELGKTILPGTQVKTYNDFPRFFDLSIVVIGADRTSFVLGKVAADAATLVRPSADVAEALGITDEWFEKIAYNKIALDKQIDGSKEKIDGKIIAKLRASLDNTCDHAYDEQPSIPTNLLDMISSGYGYRPTLSTMMGLGIMPKPQEFQRIILIAIKRKPDADRIGDHDLISRIGDAAPPDTECLGESEFGMQHMSPAIANLLYHLIPQRSLFHKNFIIKLSNGLEKQAAEQKQQSTPEDLRNIAGILGLAALYSVFMSKAKKLSPEDVAKAIQKAPYLKALFISSPLLMSPKLTKIQEKISEGLEGYNVLPDPHFIGTGIEKNAQFWQGLGVGALSLPAYYMIRAKKRQQALYGGEGPGIVTSSPVRGAIGTGVAAGVLGKFGPRLAKRLLK